MRNGREDEQNPQEPSSNHPFPTISAIQEINR